MQKRIVILGGVGFIGTHLCLRLLEEGHEVFCVDIRDAVNSPLLRSVLQHPLFRYVHHNIINTFGIRCDEIYNLTSSSRVRYNKALPVETLRINQPHLHHDLLDGPAGAGRLLADTVAGMVADDGVEVGDDPDRVHDVPEPDLGVGGDADDALVAEGFRRILKE